MARSEEERFLETMGKFLPALITGLMEAMGRAPTRKIQPLTEDEVEPMQEFIRTYYTKARGYRNPRLKPLALEIEWQKKIPNPDPDAPEEFVWQLNVVPIEIVRAVMKQVAELKLIELPSRTNELVGVS